MILFGSDFHLGHKVIVPKYRNFSSQEEHDNLILDQMSKLGKRDILFVLGDFIFDSPKYDYYVEQIAKMSCRIKLVMGNHDSLKLYKETRLDNVEIQLPLFSYKKFWLSHPPIHPQEIRGRIGNIHGHLHGNIVEKRVPFAGQSFSNGIEFEGDFKNLPDERYFNVCLDNNNFEFVNFEQIKEQFNRIVV